jgi:hypothetical protein
MGRIPEGVIIVTAGGLNGYSGGNFSVPKRSVPQPLRNTRNTHILAAMVRRVWRPINEIVPQKNIFLGRMGCDIRRRGFLNRLVLLRKLP